MKEEYPFEAPNKENILKIFSEQYKDSRDCLRELVANSIDAKPTLIEVKFVKNNIEVVDDGEGLNKEDFKRVTTHVADSIKRDSSDMIGIKGIGIFGSLILGSHVIWESHKKGFDPIGIKFSKEKIDRYEFIPSNIPEGITKYTIYNLTPSLKGIKPIQLCNYLTRKFGTSLQEKGIILNVRDKKGRFYLVKPEVYKGEKWKINMVVIPEISGVKGGYISFDIYLTPYPEKERNIIVRCKGVEVASNIIQIKGLDHEPWDSDIVHGEVRADFLNTTSSRDGFIEDKNLEIFVNMLHIYEPELQRLVDRKKQLIKKKKDKELKKAVDDLLDKAIKALSNLLFPLKSMPREKKGDYSKREISIPQKIIEPEKIKISEAKKTDEKKSKNLKGGYEWELESFYLEEIYLRTKLIIENGRKIILVNNSHEDYLKSTDNRNDKTYIADMIMHEIILDSYKDKEHREYMEVMQTWAITKVESWS